jgi:hypothetical protein
MTWNDAVIQVMAKRPSRDRHLQDLYAQIGELPIVSAHHRDTWGCQPNFHHWVRSTLNRLRKAGRVERVGHATWCLRH